MALAQPRHGGSDAPLDIAVSSAGLVGAVIRPGDADYEMARQVHSTLVDRRPALIVRAANPADVARTVSLARAHGLELAVRGGSHSLAGHGTTEGGVVLDLSGMKGLHIDAERRLAWAQPGLTAGEYTVAAAAHGLATPFGDTTTVGIGGLALGGGIGWLVRKHGLTIDALEAADVVTADGRLITASAAEHADLFWAIRGGGGNFGVVTRFQFRLFPVDIILGGALVLPATRHVLRSLLPVAAAAPEELSTIAVLTPAPPAPFVPQELHGVPSVVVLFVYAGEPDAGRAAIAPLQQIAEPLAEVVAPMPYPSIYEFTRAGEGRGASSSRTLFLESLDDDTVDAMLAIGAAPSLPGAMTQIRVLGGAMARIPAAETAFAHRSAPVLVNIISPFEDPGDAPIHEAWVDRYLEALRPAGSGAYSAFLGDEGEARVRQAYPDATYRRLAEIKRRYDHSNLFHLNQNIRPAPDA